MYMYLLIGALLTARRKETSATSKSTFEKNSDQEQEKDNKARRRYPWQYWNYYSNSFIWYTIRNMYIAFLIFEEHMFYTENWGVWDSNVRF